LPDSSGSAAKISFAAKDFPKGKEMMRKYLAATVVGVLLIAGQASASNSADPNLGDRIVSVSDMISSDDAASHQCFDEHGNRLDRCGCSYYDGNGNLIKGRCGNVWAALSVALFIGLVAWGFTEGGGNGSSASP
jgi:hypothetical protein